VKEKLDTVKETEDDFEKLKYDKSVIDKSANEVKYRKLLKARL